jgi:hypothetical protein
MKKLILLPLVLLSGCIHRNPVAPKFPDAPATLLAKCAGLKEATEGMSLTALTKTVVDNYILYHKCNRKVEGWNEWYTKQKEIFEAATKK